MICIYRITNVGVLLEELCVGKEQFGNIDGSAIKAHCDFNEKLQCVRRVISIGIYYYNAISHFFTIN